MTWRPRDHASAIHALLALLPLGEVWPREVGSTLYKAVAGLTGVVAAFWRRTGGFLLYEAFPPYSFYLLPDWERVLGLPEPCFPQALTIEERRAAVAEKIRRRPGGQSRAYFLTIARRLGYDEPPPSQFQLPLELPAQIGRQHSVTIREFRPFMAGVSRAGDPTWRIAPPKMRFCWVVTVPGERLTWFRAGISRAGVDTHLAIRRADDLECVLGKYKPAHTILFFDYQGA